MKIAILENSTLSLESSPAYAVLNEWHKLLSLKHEVTYIKSDLADLDDYNIVIVHSNGGLDKSCIDKIKNATKPIIYYYYHERGPFKDIKTDDGLILELCTTCDFVLTYSPAFLRDIYGVQEDYLKHIDIITYYNDPSEYLKKDWISSKKRRINFLHNYMNDGKSYKLFLEWCATIKSKEKPNVLSTSDFALDKRVLKKYKTDSFFANNTEHADILIEDSKDRRQMLLQNATFAWLVDEPEEYKEFFTNVPTQEMLEAMFCGCIPVVHKRYATSELYTDNDMDKFTLFYDEEKGFEDLYNQYRNINIIKAQRNLKHFAELYKAKELFLNGLELTLTPQSAFDYVKGMAEQVKDSMS